jgi:hypothetical protein
MVSLDIKVWWIFVFFGIFQMFVEVYSYLNEYMCASKVPLGKASPKAYE